MLKPLFQSQEHKKGIKLASITKTINQLEHLNSLYKEDNFTKHIQNKIKKLRELYKIVKDNG